MTADDDSSSFVCPESGSAEISLPSHSEPFNTCADCGHSWGGWLDLDESEGKK